VTELDYYYIPCRWAGEPYENYLNILKKWTTQKAISILKIIENHYEVWMELSTTQRLNYAIKLHNLSIINESLSTATGNLKLEI
jgi:hypothetical protein